LKHLSIADSPTLKAMSMYAESAGWASGIWKAAPSPIIKLGCSYKTVLSRLKGKDRYNLRRRQAKLAETGSVELEVVTDRGVERRARTAMQCEYHTYSPGHLLLLEILAKSCEQGCKAYDFLGADDEWKFMWTKEVRNHHWLFLFPNRPLPLALRFAKFEVLPRIRRLRTRQLTAQTPDKRTIGP
jgi:CelD/BcsL family acetyltransferase involved in cellulose biosynthesis